MHKLEYSTWITTTGRAGKVMLTPGLHEYNRAKDLLPNFLLLYTPLPQNQSIPFVVHRSGRVIRLLVQALHQSCNLQLILQISQAGECSLNASLRKIVRIAIGELFAWFSKNPSLSMQCFQIPTTYKISVKLVME